MRVHGSVVDIVSNEVLVSAGDLQGYSTRPSCITLTSPLQPLHSSLRPDSQSFIIVPGDTSPSKTLSVESTLLNITNSCPQSDSTTGIVGQSVIYIFILAHLVIPQTTNHAKARTTAVAGGHHRRKCLTRYIKFPATQKRYKYTTGYTRGKDDDRSKVFD